MVPAWWGALHWTVAGMRATMDLMEPVRTGVQRRTLIGALMGAAAVGAAVVALIPGGSDGGGSERISEVVETTTTVEATTTTEAPTTTEATTAAPSAAPAPIKQQVADHEQRIDQLEATTTSTTAPQPSSTTEVPGLDDPERTTTTSSE